MIMLNPTQAATEVHESWAPLLGLAAREVFDLMMGGQLDEAPEPFGEERLEITSMVGLAGQICGMVTLRCSAKAATLMAAKMLGVGTAEAGPEMWDAVGEICNMIAGNFKNKIAVMRNSCLLSVPAVIRGTDYVVRAVANSGGAEIHLLFEGLPMIVAVEVHT